MRFSSSQVLKLNMQKEMALAQSSHTLVSLVRTPTVRRISCCISSVWCASLIAFHILPPDNGPGGGEVFHPLVLRIKPGGTCAFNGRLFHPLSLSRFATSFSYYGLAMDLQNFGFSLYLIQVAFGSIDIPAKLGAAIGMSYVGRRATQASSLILAGLAILANIFVPPGESLRGNWWTQRPPW